MSRMLEWLKTAAGWTKVAAFALVVLAAPIAAVWFGLRSLPPDRHAVTDRLDEFGTASRTRLLPKFLRAGVPYPPEKVMLVGLKAERKLQIYAAGHDGRYRYIDERRVLAAAGGPGPKLRAGDRQVPEGIYGIKYLNPNSVAYVSLLIGYPNDFDRARAKDDGRTNLGGDIAIHGPTTGTAGCLALTKDGVQDVFTLVADSGAVSTHIILAPHDLRYRGAAMPATAKPWVKGLYTTISEDLGKLPYPGGSGSSSGSAMPSAAR
jgi:L,D-transpeptidase catalytic domain